MTCYLLKILVNILTINKIIWYSNQIAKENWHEVAWKKNWRSQEISKNRKVKNISSQSLYRQITSVYLFIMQCLLNVLTCQYQAILWESVNRMPLIGRCIRKKQQRTKQRIMELLLCVWCDLSLVFLVWNEWPFWHLPTQLCYSALKCLYPKIVISQTNNNSGGGGRYLHKDWK